MGKIRMPKPISQATGPVYTINNPIKFSNGSKSKMKADKPERDTSGGSLRPNTTHIPSMNADKAPKTSKSMGEKTWIDPHSVKHPGPSDFGGSVAVKNPSVK